MVRLGRMAMAAQLRPAGQSMVEAAVEGRMTHSVSLNGGSSPGRRSCANSAGARDPRQRLVPTVYAKSGTRGKGEDSGTKDADGEEIVIIGETIAEAYGNGYEEYQRDQQHGTLPAEARPRMHMITNTMVDVVWAGTTMKVETRTGKCIGRSLALTSPRPVRPMCA